MVSLLMFGLCVIGSTCISKILAGWIYHMDLQRTLDENDVEVEEAVEMTPVSPGILALDRFTVFALSFISLSLLWK
jgi:hypothetical protein